MAGLPLPASVQKSLESSKVEYVKLGTSGLRVSRPILGAMTFGFSPFVKWIMDEEPSLEILKAAYDCGINTWDTANTYSNGVSEEIIGKAIRKFNIPRHKLVLMTKCSFVVGEEPDVMGAMYQAKLHQSKDYVNHGGECESIA